MGRGKERELMCEGSRGGRRGESRRRGRDVVEQGGDATRQRGKRRNEAEGEGRVGEKRDSEGRGKGGGT